MAGKLKPKTGVRIVAGAFCIVDRRGRIIRASRFGTHFWAAGRGSWTRRFGDDLPPRFRATLYAGVQPLRLEPVLVN